MRCFRVGYIGESDTILLSDAGQIHHLKDVLRLARRDEITIFDDEGRECLCSVDGFEREGITLTVVSRARKPPRKARLTVACAVPKRGMDEIVSKLTQLGTYAIVPMRTERTVVKLGEDSARSKVERWKRLAQASAEQSQRSDVPDIGQVTEFNNVVSHASAFDLRVIPTLSGERRALSQVLADIKPASVLALIGPEGDFTDQEVERAREAGFLPISLGAHVLRVDTAAISLAAYLRLAGVI